MGRSLENQHPSFHSEENLCFPEPGEKQKGMGLSLENQASSFHSQKTLNLDPENHRQNPQTLLRRSPMAALSENPTGM